MSLHTRANIFIFFKICFVILSSIIQAYPSNNYSYFLLEASNVSQECHNQMLYILKPSIPISNELSNLAYSFSGIFPIHIDKFTNLLVFGGFDNCLRLQTSLSYSALFVDVIPLRNDMEFYFEKHVNNLPMNLWIPDGTLILGICLPTACNNPRDLVILFSSLKPYLGEEMRIKAEDIEKIRIYRIHTHLNGQMIEHLINTKDNLSEIWDNHDLKNISSQLTSKKKLNLSIFLSLTGILLLLIVASSMITKWFGKKYYFKDKILNIIIDSFAVQNNLSQILYTSSNSNSNHTPRTESKNYAKKQMLKSSAAKTKERSEINLSKPILNNSSLPFLRGIKALSTLHVIYGHTYLLSVFAISNFQNFVATISGSYYKNPISDAQLPNELNVTTQFIQTKPPSFDYITLFLFSAFFAVDTFFFMSGFLASWSSPLVNTWCKKHFVQHKSCGPTIKKTKNRINDTKILPQTELNNYDSKDQENLETRLETAKAGDLNNNNISFKGGKRVKNLFSSLLNNFILPIIYRYLRLTPLYGAIIAFEVMVLPYVTDWGPLGSTLSGIDPDCRTHWIYNLLYMANFFTQKSDIKIDDTKENDKSLIGSGVAYKMCMPWAWYLSCDFQFHLIAPLFVYLMLQCLQIKQHQPSIDNDTNKNMSCLKISFTYVWWLLSILLTFLTFVAYQVSYVNKYRILTFTQDVDIVRFFMEYYIKPYIRMPPFIFGLFLAFYLKLKQTAQTGFPLLNYLEAKKENFVSDETESNSYKQGELDVKTKELLLQKKVGHKEEASDGVNKKGNNAASTNDTHNKPLWICLSLFSFTLAISSAMIYVHTKNGASDEMKKPNYPISNHDFWESMFLSLSRFIWPFIIAIFVYAFTLIDGTKVGSNASLNNRTKLNFRIFVSIFITPFYTLLADPIWVPISNLSYGAYLLHPVVMFTYLRSLRSPLYFSHMSMFVLMIFYSVITFALALCFSLIIEFPVWRLAKNLIMLSSHSKNPIR